MGNCLSSPFSVSNGVRQGGVLSPYLFALYIDDLSVKLNCVKAGCFFNNSRPVGESSFQIQKND